MSATTTLLHNFATLLQQKNYKASTIKLYVSHLKRSGVDLRDRGRVHEVVQGHIFGDLNGHMYRSLRLYDRFMNDMPIQVMPPKKEHSRLTVRDACLALKNRSDVGQAWWLMRRRGYAPTTAIFYVNSSGKLDKNKNGRRARLALQDYEPTTIDDPVVLNHYRNLSM